MCPHYSILSSATVHVTDISGCQVLLTKMQVFWEGTSCYMVTIYRRFGGACRLLPPRQTVQEKSLEAQSFQEIPSCTVWPCEYSDVGNSLPVNMGKHPRTIGSLVGLNVVGVSFKF